jgi:hypothetical protein
MADIVDERMPVESDPGCFLSLQVLLRWFSFCREKEAWQRQKPTTPLPLERRGIKVSRCIRDDLLRRIAALL